jgi:hypothetical protein
MSTWTSEQDKKLRDGAAAGMSAKEIGDTLNRTRNSILGRAFRLGISMCGDPKPRGKPVTVKPPQNRVANRKVVPRVAVSNVVQFPSLAMMCTDADYKPVSLLDLDDGMCKWPVGDMFCGRRTPSNRDPYCMGHATHSRLKARHTG